MVLLLPKREALCNKSSVIPCSHVDCSMNFNVCRALSLLIHLENEPFYDVSLASIRNASTWSV